MSRADTSLFGRWWFSLDRWTLAAVAMLVMAGYVMVLASPPSRLPDARDMLILKQLGFLSISGAMILLVSLLSARGVRRLSLALFLVVLLLTALTLVIGHHTKGATRQIVLHGFSLQPSEFLKPCFAVVTAWLLNEGRRGDRFPGLAIALLLMAVIGGVMVLQPDMGMLTVLLLTFLVQLFISGLPIAVIGIGGLLAGVGGVVAYFTKSHVQERVNDFLFPAVATCVKRDQICMSLQAFGNGGLLGRGPGEGMVKETLPDGHTDFVFAVVGEEFGMVVCLGLVLVFGFIVLRAFARLLREPDMFIVVAVSGLATSFGFQTFVNMASSLGLIPTKGMTMPFVSYGGSSVVAVALGVGMLLALTRRGSSGELL